MDKSLIRYASLEKFGSLIAFTTTRNSLLEGNVRFTNGSSPQAGNNRKSLAELLGIKPTNLVFPKQTHSARVESLEAIPKGELSDTDAIMTNKTEICLCVQTADCVPILLYDKAEGVIAAVHAGWRGTVANIASNTIDQMIAEYGSSPKNVIAVIGPAIGPLVYEVGNEVIELVEENVPHPELTISKRDNGSHYLNLWEANRQLLMEKGVLPEHIEVAGSCTFSGSDRFFSARRDGVKTGRMVSGIMLTS